MVFDIFLYTSLAVFVLGVVYKMFTWISRDVGAAVQEVTTARRLSSAVRGVFGVVFSAKILPLIKVLLLDVILQIRIVRDDVLRWLMHILIYGGFMLLLLMHALEAIVSENIFSGYYNTLNPYFFLRDLFGAMVIAGLLIAVYRRFVGKAPRFKTSAMDVYAIAILAVIMCTGILLEGLKLTSDSEFMAYAEEYADIDEEEEIQGLKAYWAENFGLVSADIEAPPDEDMLSLGEEAHDNYCASCHSPGRWAFAGYATAKVLKPVALPLDAAGAVNILLYVHFLACFIGLAYLPFSKMFHIVVSPLSLLANAVMDETSDPVNIATRQVMELDACMHCGTCTQRCSAAMAFETIGNSNILPSEKMHSLKAYAAGRDPGEPGLRAIQEGIYLCTNCDRCTVACPAGINLRDLWFNAREKLLRQGGSVPLTLSPFSFYRGLNRHRLNGDGYAQPVLDAKAAIASKSEYINNPDAVIPLTPSNKAFKDSTGQSIQAKTYAYCFSCENCTTVCPVVGNYENPQETLGLLPHQIMRSVGLGIKDLAIGSGMLWDCTTCYQCQEHCPQGVKVTDVLYELKNQAVNPEQ